MKRVITPATDLGAWMLHDFVHRKMCEARDTNNYKLLADLPAWAKRMIDDIGRNAGLKNDAVRELVGDD